ncbi:MAG: hypothetical protein LYZ70_03380 [Nitrososphaerales archaeon]|nr:hypothetical protein [Nitrososphaerales archaeon]
MSTGQGLLTGRGRKLVANTFVVLLLLAGLVIGAWALYQTMNAVVALGRNYVNLPFYPLPIDVWSYHDAAYSLIWLAYIGFVLRKVTPWRSGSLTTGRVIVSLAGFASVTAGLWLRQDVMNAVLVMGRQFIDLPFFAARLDLLNAANTGELLVLVGFVFFLSAADLP